MKEERIREIGALIRRVTVAVYGDFCLDAYWLLDARGSERSVETGLDARAVGRHYYSLGGASNIVANLAALQPAEIRVIGVIGDDIFGRELTRQMKSLGVDTTWLVVQEKDFDTVKFHSYDCLPYQVGVQMAFLSRVDLNDTGSLFFDSICIDGGCQIACNDSNLLTHSKCS